MLSNHAYNNKIPAIAAKPPAPTSPVSSPTAPPWESELAPLMAPPELLARDFELDFELDPPEPPSMDISESPPDNSEGSAVFKEGSSDFPFCVTDGRLESVSKVLEPPAPEESAETLEAAAEAPPAALDDVESPPVALEAAAEAPLGAFEAAAESPPGALAAAVDPTPGAAAATPAAGKPPPGAVVATSESAPLVWVAPAAVTAGIEAFSVPAAKTVDKETLVNNNWVDNFMVVCLIL